MTRDQEGRAAPGRGLPAVQAAVIGAGDAGAELCGLAREVGTLIAARGWVLVCGGLGGVMEAASDGASSQGGVVVGLLPGLSRAEGNSHLGLSLPTGMGEGRNVLIARAADVLIAVGGGYGTLSEIALGLKMGKPVVSLRSWSPGPEVRSAGTAREAVEEAARSLGIRVP